MSSHEQDQRLEYARRYIERGWKIFVLGPEKRPLASCDECHRADYTHDREACDHLHCHGFYAATDDIERVRRMLLHPRAELLAVRTGSASGIMVIDAEATDRRNDGLTGLEVLDQWDGWVPEWSIPQTLTARTGGGGLHIYLALQPGERLRGRNRILPNIDVKSEGGYVAVPSGARWDGREWLNQLEIAPAPPEARQWIIQNRTRVSEPGGHERAIGYDYERCLREGPGRGERDEFFNDLLFRQRKAGATPDAALAVAYEIWSDMGQDPNDRDVFLWDWIEYKADRVWSTVEPGETARDGYLSWTVRLNQTSQAAMGETNSERGDAHVPGSIAVTGPPPAFEVELSETGNVHRFTRLFADRLLFIPRLGWHIWDGVRWARDDVDDVFDMTQEVLLQLRREQLAAAGTDHEADIRAWYKTSSGVRSREATLRGARSDPRLKIGVDMMNTDPWQLVVQNGTVDLRTRRLRPSRPEDHNTHAAAVRFDVGARCPNWLRHIELVCQTRDGTPDAELVAYLRRWMGYTLTGSVQAQRFPFLYGGGNNGKNVTVETLLSIMGDYAMRASSKLLLGSGQEHETVIADLAGARLVFIDETPKGKINEARLKELTGTKRIRARKIAKDSFEFDMRAKLWLAGNNKPRVSDTSDGFWRRLDLIPFDRQIPAVEQISDFGDVLLREASGILNWCLDGLADWQSTGALGRPARVEAAGQAYRDDEDSLEQFITDRFAGDGLREWIPNKVIHTVYSDWCQDHGIRDVRSMIALGQELERHGFERDPKTRKVRWLPVIGDEGGLVRVERGWLAPTLAVTSHLRWRLLAAERTEV